MAFDIKSVPNIHDASPKFSSLRTLRSKKFAASTVYDDVNIFSTNTWPSFEILGSSNTS